MVNIFQSNFLNYQDAFGALGPNQSDPRAVMMARRALLGTRDPISYSDAGYGNDPARNAKLDRIAAKQYPNAGQTSTPASSTPSNGQNGGSLTISGNNTTATQTQASANSTAPHSVADNIFADFFGLIGTGLNGSGVQGIGDAANSLVEDAKGGFKTSTVHNPFTNLVI